MKKREIKVLIGLIIFLFILNYSSLDNSLESFLNLDSEEEVFVERIVDGDTIDIGNRTVRLLGINTPERGEVLYLEAKEFLAEEVLNKTVTLKFGKERYDKYDRILAYVFIGEENINQKIIEEGFANYYFPSGKDKYYTDFVDAWGMCVVRNKNLCEKSQDQCTSCIKLLRDRSLVNSCNINCNLTGWTIKPEGRKYFKFSGTLVSGEETGFNINLTRTGDTIFLRDGEGKLILWKKV